MLMVTLAKVKFRRISSYHDYSCRTFSCFSRHETAPPEYSFVSLTHHSESNVINCSGSVKNIFIVTSKEQISRQNSPTIAGFPLKDVLNWTRLSFPWSSLHTYVSASPNISRWMKIEENWLICIFWNRKVKNEKWKTLMVMILKGLFYFFVIFFVDCWTKFFTGLSDCSWSSFELVLSWVCSCINE